MSFKRFRDQDLVYTTLKAYPEYNFIVNSGDVYFQKERTKPGDLSGDAIRHVATGSVSLYELNIDRPGDKSGPELSTNSLVSAFVPAMNAGFKVRPSSMTPAERLNLNVGTATIDVTYPLSASLSRIYVPEDQVFLESNSDPNRDDGNQYSPSPNRKYITALKTLINHPDDLQRGDFSRFELAETNIISVPAILYGSEVKKGSVKLDYYVDGRVIASAEDSNSNGNLICTKGPASIKGTQVGLMLYNQGLALLTCSLSLDASETDNYYNQSSVHSPSWINFGTGIPLVGDSNINPGACSNSSYSISFKGTNKIPSLTMFAFSEKGEHNYSHNPTFLERTLKNEEVDAATSLLEEYIITTSSFSEPKKNIKKVNKSKYHDEEAEFVSTTYISKVGIYDKDKNLIAVATLANPAKKTNKRDFMIKMKLDF